MTTLSFVTGSKETGDLDYWNYCLTTEYGATDGADLGRKFAAELCEYIADTEFTPMLAFVVDAISKKGPLGTVEIAFFNYIAEKLL